MATTATAASAGPRYAPEDPTLPKPWRGLVDGKTGYLYFWNPETNVTQYERPALPKSSSIPMTSSVQVHQSSRQGYSPPVKEDDRYGRPNNAGSKPDALTRSSQSARGTAIQYENVPNGMANGLLTRGHGSSAGGSGMSGEAYRRRHEISVTGDDVPPPLSSFEATGFPSEILKEVRYLLLRGANVVRCAALPLGALHIIWSALIWWTIFLGGLSESPKFVAGTVFGDGLVYHLVRTEEEASSCSSLHQQAFADCIWGMMLLLPLATL